MDTVNNAISSLDSGLNGVAESVSNLFGDAKVSDGDFSPIDSTFDFFKDSSGKAFSFLFGSDGSMGLESEDGINASTSKPTKGIFEKTVDFTKKNPETAKLGAGLIGGAMQAYQKEKDRGAAEELLKQKSEYESKLLREKYGYETQATKEKQSNAFGSFMNPNKPTSVTPFNR